MEPMHGPLKRPRVTRLAPSPSGALHLGNACTFLVNWALARANAWRIVLRIEDLDRPRVRAGAEEEILASLAWLGIDFDETAPRQSARGEAYSTAMTRLALRGIVFESRHSRAEVRAASETSAPGRSASERAASERSAPGRSASEGAAAERSALEAAALARAPRGPEGDEDSGAASAPHADGRALRFPPCLRPQPGAAWGFRDPLVNHRLRVDEQAVEIDDEVAGPHCFALADDPGDPIIWSKAGIASYQLAVVVDDGAAGVTDVVRGEDLLQSAAIQSVIAKALDLPAPRWWHFPLVLDEAGRRLSKRDGDLALAALRARGTAPERVIGLVAHWIGAIERPEDIASKELISLCTPERLRAWSRGPRPRLDATARAWLRT